MDLYIVLVTGFGLVVLLTAWLPMLSREWPLSLPILCVVLGYGLFSWPFLSESVPNPLENRAVAERITEFVVIVALMGAGLKLDRPVSWRGWALTWRLLAISMPLTILAIAVLGASVLGLGLASAVLLGAALASTDPVLASDVQVGPPGGDGEEEAEERFALTSEAGLNDGLAFPFVNLAVALAIYAADGREVFADWLLIDVAWKLGAGLACGWLAGRGLGFVMFHLPLRANLSGTGDGFVALGVTCLVYGLAELVHGYGFLAVFVAAVTLRGAERRHEYHHKLHDFSDQIERLLTMVLMVMFGATLAEGTLLGALDWRGIAIAFAVVFLVRPVCGWVGLLGSGLPRPERAVIAAFGIRGLGSIYYLAYALGRAEFPEAAEIWSIIGFVILLSVFVHGVSATPIMRRLERYRRGWAEEVEGDERKGA